MGKNGNRGKEEKPPDRPVELLPQHPEAHPSGQGVHDSGEPPHLGGSPRGDPRGGPARVHGGARRARVLGVVPSQKGEMKMSSNTLERLPRSAQLLVDFTQYCEIRRDCPHLSMDEQGAPKCHHRDLNGECKFENCPRMSKEVFNE